MIDIRHKGRVVFVTNVWVVFVAKEWKGGKYFWFPSPPVNLTLSIFFVTVGFADTCCLGNGGQRSSSLFLLDNADKTPFKAVST